MTFSPWLHITLGFIGYFVLILLFIINPQKKYAIYVVLALGCFGQIMIGLFDLHGLPKYQDQSQYVPILLITGSFFLVVCCLTIIYRGRKT